MATGRYIVKEEKVMIFRIKRESSSRGEKHFEEFKHQGEWFCKPYINV